MYVGYDNSGIPGIYLVICYVRLLWDLRFVVGGWALLPRPHLFSGPCFAFLSQEDFGPSPLLRLVDARLNTIIHYQVPNRCVKKLYRDHTTQLINYTTSGSYGSSSSSSTQVGGRDPLLAPAPHYLHNNIKKVGVFFFVVETMNNQ